MMEAKVYRCPCCGSDLTWSGQTGGMKCDQCGNSFPLETLQGYAENDIRDNAAEDFRWDRPAEGTVDGDTSNLRAFSCPGCGAQMVVSDTAAAQRCPYCGNDAVMPQVLEGKYRPDAIIPFKKTREEAVEAYRQLCRKKKLVSRHFLSNAVMDKITGIYVPFWLFDCDADADCTYNCTRSSTRREGQYMVTYTKHYLVRRSGDMGFRSLPVNSSTKLDDTLMESVEPFQADDSAAFDPGYIAGFQAERFDQGAETCQRRAAQRIRVSAAGFCRADVTGYGTVTPKSTRVNIRKSRSRNVLMPVWILNNTWKGKNYTFAMNGQTGKIIGNLPMDPTRTSLLGAGLFLGIGLAAAAIVYFLIRGGAM